MWKDPNADQVRSDRHCSLSHISHPTSPIRPFNGPNQAVRLLGPENCSTTPSSRSGNQRGAAMTKGRIADQ